MPRIIRANEQMRVIERFRALLSSGTALVQRGAMWKLGQDECLVPGRDEITAEVCSINTCSEPTVPSAVVWAPVTA